MSDGATKQTFFWQGLLILLPAALLTVAGGFSVWRDRTNTHREADERARAEALRIVTGIADQFRPFPTAPFQVSADSSAFQIQMPGGAARFVRNRSGEIRSLFASDQPVSGGLIRFSPVESWPSIPLNRPLEDPVLRAAGAEDGALFCILDAPGNLAFPPPMEMAPQPSGDSNSLPAQWLEARGAYARALSAANSGNARAARAELGVLATNDTGALSEAGLPLQTLALYLACSIEGRRTNAQPLLELTAAAVLRPSALSDPLLDQAKAWSESWAIDGESRQIIADWRRVWQAHERARALWLEWNANRRTNWLETPEGAWIVQSRTNNGCGIWIARRQGEVQAQLEHIVMKLALPEYLALTARAPGFWLVLDPRAFGPPPNAGNITRSHALAAHGKFPWTGAPKRQSPVVEWGGKETTPALGAPLAGVEVPFAGWLGSESLRVECVLADPDRLYLGEKRRLAVFAFLIGAAGLTALAGFFTARRAFYRQLKLNEMKSNFVSAVSHELRAPIASVRLLAEGLDRGKITEPQKQKEYFRFIVQECRRLTSLIENVLDYSRIEQGRKKYEMEPTDIAALLEQTVKLMSPNAEERQTRIELRLPEGDIPQAVCDGLAVQQALINLIDNAVKHSPPGAVVAVGISAPPSEINAAGRLELWVEDQGSGIPLAEHEKIFERFYRRGSELRRETQGIGIGLTIVKHIAEAHGGRVRVQSAVGRGSRFTLELPLCRES